MTTITGRINRYGTDACARRGDAVAAETGGRGLGGDRHLATLLVQGEGDVVARNRRGILDRRLPVRMRGSIVRRTLPFSTLIQFFDVGTNQLLRAARSFTLLPSRLVVFGMLPFARSAVIEALSVKAPIQAAPAALFAPIGTARSEPPRKPGMAGPSCDSA